MSTTSPNMNLVIPDVLGTNGPTYATQVNAALSVIDAHNHSPGSGVQITPQGITINSDLTFGGNNGTNLRSVRFTSQPSPLSVATNSLDIRCIFVSGVDLYYNDGNSNQVRITQNGGVGGSPGSITNLTAPASATYSSGTQTFVWQSDTNTPANMDGASFLIRNLLANSKALTLSAPAAMAANYTVTLPALPTASTKLLTMDTSGNQFAITTVDNTTLQISSNLIGIKAGGVGPTQLSSLNIVQTSDCGSYQNTTTSYTQPTNLAVAITSHGRPVMVTLQSISTDNSGVTFSNPSNNNYGIVSFKRDSTIINNQLISGSSSMTIPASSFSFVDIVGAGTYTYSVQGKCFTSPGGTLNMSFCNLTVWEM